MHGILKFVESMQTEKGDQMTCELRRIWKKIKGNSFER